MSIILSLETSIPEASVALSLSGEIIAQEEFESHRQQNKLLFPALEKVICALPEKLAPDLIIVGTGPGSYSGSRISIAAAQGLAIAYHCPVVGLCSFLGTSTMVLLPLNEFIEKINNIDVSSTPLFSFEKELPIQAPYLVDKSHAVSLIRAWEKLTSISQENLLKTPPQPAYLRAPFITKAKPGHPLLRQK